MNQDSRPSDAPERTPLSTAAIAHAGQTPVVVDKPATIDDEAIDDLYSEDTGTDRSSLRASDHMRSESDANTDRPAAYARENNGDRPLIDQPPRDEPLIDADLAESRTADKYRDAESPQSPDRAGVPAGSQGLTDSEHAAPLFTADESNSLNSRWDSVQVAFVDEPRQAVQKADELVASAIKRLAEVFAAERTHLEEQWDRGDSISTEDLRVALQRYRSFFRRLLAV